MNYQQKDEPKIVPFYKGSFEDFFWVGFGSGNGTNLRECAKVIQPWLIFSDRVKAPLLNLEELACPKLILSGIKYCGKINEQTPEEYEQKCIDYNELIVEKLYQYEEDQGKEIDLIVLGGYMRLLKKPLLRKYKDKIINVHPADLSVIKQTHEGLKRIYAGKDAVNQAINEGLPKTRSSVILVNEGVDTGEILGQGKWISVNKDLTEKIKESDWSILPVILKLIAEGRLGVGIEKNQLKDWRTIYLDGKRLPYGGYDIK